MTIATIINQSVSLVGELIIWVLNWLVLFIIGGLIIYASWLVWKWYKGKNIIKEIDDKELKDMSEGK